MGNQWKMLFNPDISKQAIEIIFSNKINKANPPLLMFNGIPVKWDTETKHLGVVLDSQLTFKTHLEGTNGKLPKARQGLGLMRQLKRWVSPSVLETIYKLFVRVHPDQGDILYHVDDLEKHSVWNLEATDTLLRKVEMIQYNAARIVTGAWFGSDKKELYANLGWESLNNRRIMRKLCLLHETYHTQKPSYMDDVVNEVRPDVRPAIRPVRNIPNAENSLENIPYRTDYYHKSFFPSTIRDWNSIDLVGLRCIESKDLFKSEVLKIIRPKKKSIFGLREHNRVRHIFMLRLEHSPLHSHKEAHGFPNTYSGCDVCETEENTEHYFLTCISYCLSRATMLQKVSDIIDVDLSTLPKRTQISILLYGRVGLSDDKNLKILKAVTDFTVSSKRLDTV